MTETGWLWKDVFHPWSWFSLRQLDELASYGIEEARIRAAIKRQAGGVPSSEVQE